MHNPVLLCAGVCCRDCNSATRPKQTGTANFPAADLLPNSSRAQDPITGSSTACALLVGDGNKNLVTDGDEVTLYYTTAEAINITSNGFPPGDLRGKLARHLISAWLNWLNGAGWALNIWCQTYLNDL